MFCVLTGGSVAVDSLSNISSVVCGGGGVRKHPIIALYFESENEIMFYNLEARLLYIEFLMYWGSK